MHTFNCFLFCVKTRKIKIFKWKIKSVHPCYWRLAAYINIWCPPSFNRGFWLCILVSMWMSTEFPSNSGLSKKPFLQLWQTKQQLNDASWLYTFLFFKFGYMVILSWLFIKYRWSLVTYFYVLYIQELLTCYMSKLLSFRKHCKLGQ